MFFQLLIMMNPHEFNFNVVIFSLNIGIGMMCDIMLKFPKVDIPSQKIQCIGKHGIQIFIIRKWVMPRIVHNIETDCRKINPEQGTKHYTDGPMRLYKNQNGVQKRKGSQ